MKKIIIFLIALFVIPFASVEALEETKFEKVYGDNTTSEKIVDGSSILIGNSVNANNTVKGISFSLGNKVESKGIHDYNITIGNIVTLSNTINNDGFIFGNVVTLNEEFKGSRDIVIFGNDVIINGNVDRDMIIYASKVTINSTIRGNVEIKANNIEIKDNAKIEGTLSYNADSSNKISSLASINETSVTESLNVKTTFKDVLINKLFSLLGMLIVFLAFSFIVPKLFAKLVKKNELNLFKSLSLMGYGALTLILVPIIFVLLVTFGIGLSLGLVLLTLYILAICLSNLFSGYLFGNLIWTKGFKKEKNIYIEGLIGISLVYVLSLIPFVNSFAMIISLLIGIGSIVSLFKKD